MTREQFLEQLRQALSGMKAEELEGVISYYDEMLDDRMEAGMTEEAAVNAMEPVQVIAARVLSEADVEAAAPEEGVAKESRKSAVPRAISVAYASRLKTGASYSAARTPRRSSCATALRKTPSLSCMRITAR